MRRDHETRTEAQAAIFERDHGARYDDGPDPGELLGLGGMPTHRCSPPAIGMSSCSACVAVRQAADEAERLRAGAA